MNKTTYKRALAPIIELYKDRRIELDYETPFQLLCAVVLSAQTTDKQVNRVTPPLFARVKSSKDILTLSIEEIEDYLKNINFFRNKSRFIYETGRILTEKYNGEIPDTLDELVALPGVGIKTAKVVLSVLHDMPYVAVDTHIHRVANRIGIVHTKTPEQTDRALDTLLDTKTKKKLHHPMVLFGRYHCTARAPKCKTCPVAKVCQYNAKNHSPAK